MANDLDERPAEVGKVELDAKVKVSGDCNGNAIGETIDGEAKENGHVLVHDPVVLEADRAESLEDSVVVEEKPTPETEANLASPIEVVEKSNGSLSEDVHVEAEVEGSEREAEKGKVEQDNDEIEEQDILGSSEIVEQNRESVAAGEEKVEELPEVVEAEEEEKVQELPEVAGAEEEELPKVSAAEEVEKVEESPEVAGAEEEEKIEELLEVSAAEEVEKIEESPEVPGPEEEEKVAELLEVSGAEEEEKVEESPEVAGAVEAEEEEKVEDHEVPKVVEAVESNSHVLVDEENKVEDQVILESEPDSKENEELDSQTEANSGESELPQPLEGEENLTEETSKSVASEESVENQDFRPSVVEAYDSESQQIGNGEEIQELSTEVGQDAQITATQPVETETCKAGEPSDYIFVDKPLSDVEAENVSSDDVKVKPEATDDTCDFGATLDTVPVEQPSVESDVTDNSAESQDQNSIKTIVEVGSEHPIVNGHVESTELSSSVVEKKYELDVEDVSAENGEALMSGTVASPDVNVSIEEDESRSASPIDNLKPESVCDNGAIEGNQSKLETTEVADEIEGSPNTPSIEQTASENEMTSDSVEGQDRSSTDPVARIESEPSDVNGHVENAALSSLSFIEVKPEADVEAYAENEDSLSAGQVPRTDVEVSVKRDDNMLDSSVDDLKSESVLSNGSIEKNHSIPSNPGHDLERENATDDIIGHIKLPAGADSESESGGINSSTSNDELSSTEVSLLSNGPVVNGESDPGFKNDVKSIKSEQDQPICGNSNGISVVGDGIKGINSNGISPEDSSTGALEATKVECEAENKPFRYLIKIPRYVDEKYSSQIELAQKQVDEKTRNREEIRLQIQSRRATAGEYRDKFEAARSEERASRNALNAKRREMDSVLSVINRMKNATSFEDMNERVRNMEHRIEHETVPLKEEKQLIREIKQLKQQLREQLSSSLGQQDEIEPTADERVKIEERFKLLKQEMESCKKEVVRLEGITKAAWKVYSDENEKVKDLQSQYRAADNLRQDAYTQLHNIKKQMYEKNQYFRTFNEEIMRAKDYASSRDREALHSHCTNQVDRIMELWNNSDEFRKEYIRCNKMSTLRRLRTVDGRALGPEEPAPILYNVRDQKVDSSLLTSANKIQFPSLPASEKGKSVGQEVANVEQKPKADSKTVVNLEQKFPTVKSKTITKTAAVSENGRVTVSGKVDNEGNAGENKKTREEEELARKEEELRKKEEELRKKEEAAKLKEQRRLEEKAKAKEAEERKRRNAEKAQARAELRAQKEAELKEKERDKKAKKKERKKGKVEAATGDDEVESVPRSENTQPETTPELEIKDKPKTLVKRTLIAKQAKPKVIPPPLPLRNRGKKRMQQWMWIVLVVLIIVALFLVGNLGFSFKFGLPSFHS